MLLSLVNQSLVEMLTGTFKADLKNLDICESNYC